MDETQALREADQMFRAAPHRAGEIRARSANLVVEPHGFWRRGLVLLEAAPRIAAPGPSRERRLVAALTGLRVQIELLWTGWQSMLDGHYAAASVPLRQISELNDYILAAAVDATFAERLLADEQVRVAEARKVIVPHLGTGPEADEWVEYRKRLADVYNATAHARRPLLLAATHARPDRYLHIGHDLNVDQLGALARVYAQLSVTATSSVGDALSDGLADDGPWMLEHQRLWAEWGDFARRDTGGH